MICIRIKNTNPFFCLAAEEYLLKNFDDDIFMLWQSNHTVVVGKHQNALGEIDYHYLRDKNITLARRISGGGTVYHDAGNVNFTFIKNVNSPAEINFKMFTQPVVEALLRLGARATNSGRNDLLIQGKKISGNAEHVYKNRVLHHGTLLFDSDLKNLGQAIKVNPGRYESKAVQSNRSEVANISGFLATKMEIDDFVQFLIDVQLEKYGNTFYDLQENDISEIEILVREKFSTWEWNWGYSPKYYFKNDVGLDGKKLAIELQVKKGKIEGCKISGDFFSGVEATEMAAKLCGERHSFETLKEITGCKNEILYAFF